MGLSDFDLLPSLKEGDSRHRCREFSASMRVANVSNRHRAYTLSTDCCGKPCRQYVPGRVYIAVMVGFALRTRPLSFGKRHGGFYVAAVRAALARWIPSVDTYQIAPIPQGFVLKLS